MAISAGPPPVVCPPQSLRAMVMDAVGRFVGVCFKKPRATDREEERAVLSSSAKADANAACKPHPPPAASESKASALRAHHPMAWVGCRTRRRRRGGQQQQK